MIRRAVIVLFALIAAGCNLNDGAKSSDPAEIAKAARAAKGNAPSGSQVEFLYFTAKWCGPCRMVKPMFEQLKADFPTVYFHEVDIDLPDNKQLAAQYKVQSIPHFFVVADGRPIGSKLGAFRSKEEMVVFLRTNIDRASRSN